MQSFLPLDDYGLRLLPAVFGVLAIPVFYLVTRRLISSRAALFGALLITFSPLLVYYSQFGRYWSLVFLLSCVYPYAIYLDIREYNRRLLLSASSPASLRCWHTPSVLLCAGLIVWLLATHVKREHLSRLWHHRNFQWGALLTLGLAIG